MYLFKRSNTGFRYYLAECISVDIPSDDFKRGFKLNYSVMFMGLTNDPMNKYEKKFMTCINMTFPHTISLTAFSQYCSKKFYQFFLAQAVLTQRLLVFLDFFVCTCMGGSIDYELKHRMEDLTFWDLKKTHMIQCFGQGNWW